MRSQIQNFLDLEIVPYFTPHIIRGLMVFSTSSPEYVANVQVLGSIGLFLPYFKPFPIKEY